MLAHDVIPETLRSVVVASSTVHDFDAVLGGVA
jgi:hypothetical protein